jgi:cytidylate kinase
MIITIDGPTASGKSTTAQMLSHALGFFYLNSGFLYRALAYILMNNNGYTVKTIHDVTEKDIRTIALDALTYISDDGDNPHIYYKGNEITRHLKASADIDQASSIISAKGEIRKALLEVQRIIGEKHDLVIDGRDTGSVVFPYADFKFYLTAPLQVRARRWMHDQSLRGRTIKFEDALQQLRMRDERDMKRPIAPLKVPEGAIVIDNEAYTLEETVQLMYNIIKDSGSK